MNDLHSLDFKQLFTLLDDVLETIGTYADSLEFGLELAAHKENLHQITVETLNRL